MRIDSKSGSEKTYADLTKSCYKDIDAYGHRVKNMSRQV